MTSVIAWKSKKRHNFVDISSRNEIFGSIRPFLPCWWKKEISGRMSWPTGNVTIHPLSFFPIFDFEIPVEGILVSLFQFEIFKVIYFGNMFVQRKN